MKKSQIPPLFTSSPPTFSVAERLLQQANYDGLVHDKVAELAALLRQWVAALGAAQQRALVQQGEQGLGPARGGERSLGGGAI